MTRIAQISEAENMEKRRYPRTALQHFSFDASDGFKMQVTPKWTTDKGCRKTIGAEILSPPPGWVEFVIGFELKNAPKARSFIHI